MSFNESVGIHGAIVTGIGIALFIKQHIASLPSGTGHAPAYDVVDVRRKSGKQLIHQRILVAKSIRLSHVEHCGSGGSAAGSVCQQL